MAFMLLYARNDSQNRFVAKDELPAVQAASESTVAPVLTSTADDRQCICVQHVEKAPRYMFNYNKRRADIISSNRIYRETAEL